MQLQPVSGSFFFLPPPICFLVTFHLLHFADFLWERGLWQWNHLSFRFYFCCFQNKSHKEAISKFEEAGKLRRAEISKTVLGEEWRWWIRWECQRLNVAQKQMLSHCAAVSVFFSTVAIYLSDVSFLLNLLEVNQLIVFAHLNRLYSPILFFLPHTRWVS